MRHNKPQLPHHNVWRFSQAPARCFENWFQRVDRIKGQSTRRYHRQSGEEGRPKGCHLPVSQEEHQTRSEERYTSPSIGFHFGSSHPLSVLLKCIDPISGRFFMPKYVLYIVAYLECDLIQSFINSGSFQFNNENDSASISSDSSPTDASTESVKEISEAEQDQLDLSASPVNMTCFETNHHFISQGETIVDQYYLRILRRRRHH
jgi:hypothetical protein